MQWRNGSGVQSTPTIEVENSLTNLWLNSIPGNMRKLTLIRFWRNPIAKLGVEMIKGTLGRCNTDSHFWLGLEPGWYDEMAKKWNDFGYDRTYEWVQLSLVYGRSCGNGLAANRTGQREGEALLTRYMIVALRLFGEAMSSNQPVIVKSWRLSGWWIIWLLRNRVSVGRIAVQAVLRNPFDLLQDKLLWQRRTQAQTDLCLSISRPIIPTRIWSNPCSTRMIIQSHKVQLGFEYQMRTGHDGRLAGQQRWLVHVYYISGASSIYKADIVLYKTKQRPILRGQMCTIFCLCRMESIGMACNILIRLLNEGLLFYFHPEATACPAQKWNDLRALVSGTTYFTNLPG